MTPTTILALQTVVLTLFTAFLMWLVLTGSRAPESNPSRLDDGELYYCMGCYRTFEEYEAARHHATPSPANDREGCAGDLRIV